MNGEYCFVKFRVIEKNEFAAYSDKMNCKFKHWRKILSSFI